MTAKYPRPGLPGYAYGGQVGNEILEFQRQYNPFTGDLPSYGMVGSQQPGAWMFFDDEWMRSAIPQPPSNPVGPPVMGPTEKYAYEDGPDGGGADRYTDDWRGPPSINVAQAISPDYTNLESFAGYNTVEGPGVYGSYENYMGVGQGPSMMTGQTMESAPPAGWGQVPVDFAPSGPQLGGRRGAPNRGPDDLTFDPLTGAAMTPATNTEFDVDIPGEFTEMAPAQMGEPLSYSDDYLGANDLAALNAEPPGVSVTVDPAGLGAAMGSTAGPGSLVGMADYVTGQMGAGGSLGSQGMGAMAGMAGSPVGQAALGALGGFVGNVSPEAFVAQGEQPGLGFTGKSAFSGISGMAGPGAAGPAALGLTPGTPAAGAAGALMGLFGGAPLANTVEGPVGAPVGAPTMDPFAGLTDQQIDALAAGYHDQAPAVGQASPIAGFETALAAAQAAAERSSGRGKGGEDLKGGYSDDMMDSGRGRDNMAAGSSGGVGGGRGMPGIDYTGSSGTVGDKQGATGQDKGDTGDSGQGSGGSEGGNEGGGSGASGSSGTGENAGDDGGMGAWKAGGHVKRGLPAMAEKVRDAGRGKDTVLAHITPSEAMRLDAAMGGPSFNPETGLREYGFFDDVGDFLGGAAKAVAPIAGGVLGGMFGGPLGAAAGAALGTALTGGSLQKSLLAGGVAGIGAYAAPKMAGAAGDMFGGSSEGSSNFMSAGGGGDDGGGSGGFLSGIMGNPLAMVGLGAAGGLGAGYLAGNSGDNETSKSPMQPPVSQPLRYGTLAQRSYTPYQGDYSTYGQIGGGAGHSFYDNVNPGVQYYAEGGSVQSDDAARRQLKNTLGQELLSGMGPNPMRLLQTAQMAMPNVGLPSAQPQAPQLQQPAQLPPPPMPPTGTPGAWQQQAMPAWMMAQENNPEQRVTNLLNLAATGGRANGPGGGQDDMIPAMLSDGEYVVPADVVAHIGGGSNNAGANKMDALMQKLREQRNSGGGGLPPLVEEGL